jgi:hypothetical protein
MTPQPFFSLFLTHGRINLKLILIISFDDLILSCRILHPEEPFDLPGWFPEE